MPPVRAWDRAGSLPVPVDGRPARAELAALREELPSVGELFTFMRDAELRFDTLRMRIEEQTWTADGPHLIVSDCWLRHPGHVKVLTSEPARGTMNNYEVWLSDGETVKTFVAVRRVGTIRPVRARIRGTDQPDLPGMSRLYEPLTALPMETLPDAFLHPAGYCQNTLATGTCAVTATTTVSGREALIVESFHPRAVEVVADRPDFRVRVAADRETGAILRLEESIGGMVTRDAVATVFDPDATLPPKVFDFAFPSDTVYIY